MKKVFLAIILLTSTSFASTAGPSFSGTITTGGPGFGNAWSNTNNIKSTDGAVGSCVFASTFSTQADSLLLSNFGFTIPGTAVINGITVIIIRRNSGTGNVFDSNIRLLKALTISGADKANTGLNWPTTLTSATYGSSADLWSNTLAPSDVNGTGFGVQIDLSGTANGFAQADIDSVTITVTFTASNNFTKTASETVTVSPVLGINKQAIASNTVTVSPAAVAVYGAQRSTPESVGISPAVSYIHNGKSVTSDTVTLSDSSIRVAGLHFSLSESIGVAPSVLVVFPRTASDTVSLTDSIAIRQAPKRNFSESIALSISGVGSAAGVRAVSESVTLTDISVRQVTLGRSLADSGAFTDTFTRRFAYKPGPVEVVNIVGIINLGYVGRPFVDVQVQDLTLMSHAARPLLPESLTLSPSVIVSLPRFKLISEPLGLNPTTLTSHAAHRATAEFGTWRDVISSTTINVTPHSEKNTIGQSVTLSEVLVVSVRSSTKKRAVIVMSL